MTTWQKFISLWSELILLYKKNFFSFFPFVFWGGMLGCFGIIEEIMGIPKGSPVDLFLQIFVVLGQIIFYCSIMNLITDVKSNREDSFLKNLWEGICSTPAYLLYNLIFGVAVLIGGAFLVIPGLWAFFFLSLAPTLSVIDPELEENYFTVARKLVKIHWKLWSLILLFSIFMMPLQFLFMGIEDTQVRWVLESVMSFVSFFGVSVSELLMVLFYMNYKNTTLSS